MSDQFDPIGLSLRDLVLEIREDVKALRTETKVELALHDTRITTIENSGLMLRGAWMTLGISASFIAGALGLGLGVYAAF